MFKIADIAQIEPLVDRIGCDAVYFLMFDGWKEELRANRWHYASRWARCRPVILIQPHNEDGSALVSEEAVAGMPNARILWIRQAVSASSYFRDSFEQAAEVANHMRLHGYRRPLLWIYNPQLAGLYAATPAVARVYHATENYFDFDGLPPFFYSQMRAALRMSDAVVAVSEGVARSIRNNVPGLNTAVVTNGCDYAAYARGCVDDTFLEERNGFARLAVYCGNINARLDFGLLQACCAAFPSTKFLFFGPVKDLPKSDMRQWRALLSCRNFSYRGPLDPTRLPDVYASADVGIIPYQQSRVLVENGFPLKVLEMGATGLPVVSTLMKPIVGLAAAIRVADDKDSFLSALERTDRSTLTTQEREQLNRLCSAHDYDAKFREIVGIIAGSVTYPTKSLTRLDYLISDDLPVMWQQFLSPLKPYRASTRLARRMATAAYLSLPPAARKHIPARLRMFIKARLG